jgi:xylulokinase
MPDLLLGIDVGTGSSKAVLTDAAGSIVATAAIEHDVSSPRPGWYEQDAEGVWWHDVVFLCHEVFSSVRYSADDVAGVAVSAIGPCLLPLDAAGRPLRPGILYGIDTRASEQVEYLTERIGEGDLDRYAGMQLSSQAIGPKILWLQENEPEVWKDTRHLTSASSYLVFRLTGQHVIDRHTAGHSIPFMDISTLTWSDRYAATLDGFDYLPRLGYPTDQAGSVTAEAARITGLRPGTPVAVGTVDAASEAIAVGVRDPGDLMVMYGSTMFFVLVTDAALRVPGAWVTGGVEPGRYNLAAGMATAGSLTEWARRLVLPTETRHDAYARLFREAGEVPAAAEGLLLLPYFEGERTPVNDPEATGVLMGIGLQHTRAHLTRAILEGVAYGARDNLEMMAKGGAAVRRVVAVGGGTTSDLWMQIVSDVSGLAQSVPKVRIGASYGDAFLAGVAAGVLRVPDIEKWVTIERQITPSEDVASVYDAGYARYKDLYASTRHLQHLQSRDRGPASSASLPAKVEGM